MVVVGVICFIAIIVAFVAGWRGVRARHLIVMAIGLSIFHSTYMFVAENEGAPIVAIAIGFLFYAAIYVVVSLFILYIATMLKRGGS